MYTKFFVFNLYLQISQAKNILISLHKLSDFILPFKYLNRDVYHNKRIQSFIYQDLRSSDRIKI